MALTSAGFGYTSFGIAQFGDPVESTIGGTRSGHDEGVLDLEEFQYELDGFKFGLGESIEVEPPFTPGVTSWAAQMSRVPGGGRRFGTDEAEGTTWTFNLFANATSTVTALAALENAKRAWRASHLRSQAGEVSVLRYRLGDRIRRVYGRPSRFAAVPENRIMSGYIPITASFDTADDLHYDDVERVAEMSLVAGTVGGFTFPATFPLETSTERSVRQGQIVITGDEPTWVTVAFTGPGSDLQVKIGKLVAGITGTMTVDETITINPAPWARTATRQDGAPAGGRLSRGTVLQRMLLEPGTYQALFTGTDPTGRARAKVSWRGARSSL